MSKRRLPPHGQPKEAILEEILRRKRNDVDAVGSRVWSLVYYHSLELHELVQQVYGLYIAENALNPMAFPSLRQMEREVIEMVGGLVHVPLEGLG
jgi:sphinganine-1-phosphate aldolase